MPKTFFSGFAAKFHRKDTPTPMSPVLKFFFSMLSIAVFVAVCPFLLEGTLRAYDRAFDPYTHPGVLSADGGSAKFGLNKRLFRENRFSFISPEVRLELEGLAEDEAIHAPTPIRGSVAVYLLPSPTNALPGVEPPPGAETLASWAFRLEPLRTRPSSELNPHLIVAATAVDSQYDEAPAETGPATYNVTCAMVPLTDADRATFDTLPGRIFEAGTPIEFDIDIRTDLPVSNKIVFAYSRPTRSILRGTVLEPVFDRFAAAFAGEKSAK